MGTDELSIGVSPARPRAKDPEVPTIRGWRLEIERILEGGKDSFLEHVGDAAVYVEEQISLAADPVESRDRFQAAFATVVMSWHPGRAGDAWLFDLIRHFTPRSGYLRLVECLQWPGGFRGEDLSAERINGTPLRLRALHALERYFPAPPLMVDGESPEVAWMTVANYRTYLTVLRQHLDYPAYSAYAAAMLQGQAMTDAGPQGPFAKVSVQLVLPRTPRVQRTGVDDRFTRRIRGSWKSSA